MFVRTQTFGLSLWAERNTNVINRLLLMCYRSYKDTPAKSIIIEYKLIKIQLIAPSLCCCTHCGYSTYRPDSYVSRRIPSFVLSLYCIDWLNAYRYIQCIIPRDIWRSVENAQSFTPIFSFNSSSCYGLPKYQLKVLLGERISYFVPFSLLASNLLICKVNIVFQVL